LQLDVPPVGGFEEPAADAQQDRNEMDLQIVELACPKRRSRRPAPCNITARSAAATRFCGTCLDQLASIIKNRLKRIQYGPALIDGFLAQTGLTLEPQPP
jgi:putative transposase